MCSLDLSTFAFARATALGWSQGLHICTVDSRRWRLWRKLKSGRQRLFHPSTSSPHGLILGVTST
jgi:hypothetical protein